MNCCSTCKKVSKDPHFINIYFREYEIHYYRAVLPWLLPHARLLIFEKIHHTWLFPHAHLFATLEYAMQCRVRVNLAHLWFA